MRRTDGSTIDQGYTRTPEGAALSYKSIDNKRFSYVTDHLGSVIGMFNSGGGYLGGYSYSPDGEERATGPNARISENQLRYIGQLSLGGGMYKFGARYYDASQARFTQMDPSRQENNRYGYADSNPVDKLDPSGLNPIDSVLNMSPAGSSLRMRSRLEIAHR